MKKYKGYLFDLDGTIYRGNQAIPEAVRCIRRLREANIPYIFVTNNASRTNVDTARKLEDMGVPAEPENVLTSSMATAQYLKEKMPNATIFPIGEKGLLSVLEEAGFHFSETSPDCVVIGLDRKLTYEKLTTACLAIRGGATFISTNPDRAFPSERGLLPGNGALTAAIATATGVEPIYIGKPEPIIIRQALDILGIEAKDALMVGDNYHTDILAGIRAGVDTLLVETGVTTAEELERIDERPTYVAKSLDVISV